ncbi:MAG TPA: glycosyltransferase [Chitinophagaceae bacterium]|nr:glycosyltransferase [Chitinophagaceae bacterium]
MSIRVLQVGKFFPPDSGGIETTTKDLLDVNEEAYHSDVLCFSSYRKTRKELLGKCQIIRCSTIFTVASMPFSLSYCYYFKKMRNRYDIIHLHHPNPLGVICALIFKYKGKLIIHWHSDILNKGFFYRVFSPLERALLKRADKIVATSPVYITESPVLKDFRFKCSFIPSAYNESSLLVDAAEAAAIKEHYKNKKIVFSLGRHVGYKGFHFLIKAAQYLPDDVVILIGGTGPLNNFHRDLIKELGLEKKVLLPGRIPGESLGNFYAACDVFCLPSCHKAEAFGLVLIEAMRFSKAIVATNIPGSGVSWVNEHGVTGLNVENESPRALAEGLTYLLSNDRVRLEYGENAYKRYMQYFTDVQMRKSFYKLYRETSEEKKQL